MKKITDFLRDEGLSPELIQARLLNCAEKRKTHGKDS